MILSFLKGSEHKIITVDGPAASGKSTVAKRLAEGLGFRYINSGAFYRVLALALKRAGVAFEDAASLERELASTQIEFRPEDEHTFLNGEDVSDEIRTREVSEFASRVAALPAVRGQVNAKLRGLASKTNCVVDGRDIGTVVFPLADFKLYLEASLEERSRRRMLDYQRAGRQTVLSDIQAELAARDGADTSRTVAPLQLPEDALVVNSTNQSVDQVVTGLMQKIREVLSNDRSEFPKISIGLNP